MNQLLRKITLWIKSFRYRKCKTCTNYYNPRSFPRCPLCDAQQRFDEVRKQLIELNEGEDNRIMSAITGKYNGKKCD